MLVVPILLASSTFLAATYTGPDPARLLLLSADSCAFAISMKPLAADATEVAKFDEDRKKALASVQENGLLAIKFANNSPEELVAIKDFYAIAESYCKNPTNAGKTEFNAKDKAIDKLLEDSGR